MVWVENSLCIFLFMTRPIREYQVVCIVEFYSQNGGVLTVVFIFNWEFALLMFCILPLHCFKMQMNDLNVYGEFILLLAARVNMNWKQIKIQYCSSQQVKPSLFFAIVVVLKLVKVISFFLYWALILSLNLHFSWMTFWMKLL